MKKLVAFALLVCSAAALAQSLDPFAFKGVQIGASQAELLKAHPAFNCSGDRYCVLSASSCRTGSAPAECMKSMTYGGVGFRSVVASFVDGRMSSVTVMTSPASFSRLKDTLVEAFGQPASEELDAFKTKAGAEHPNVKYRWFRGDSVLSATMLSGDLDTSTVNITTKAALDEAVRRRKESVKAGAKDL